MISIIVPVLNTEQHLAECLESLLNQTFPELEIICVDNGSTDHSYDMLKAYSDMHDNVVVLRHEEGRQGAARNAGLKVATGDYVGFVDSDDFVAPDMFEQMHKKLQAHGADIAICNIRLIFQKTKKRRTHLPAEWFEQEVFRASQDPFFFRNLTVCNKLYRRSFIETHKLSFPGVLYHEDQSFVIKSLILANRIVAVDSPLYFYRKERDGAVSQGAGVGDFDVFDVMQELDTFIEEQGLVDEFGQIFVEVQISRYIQLLETVEFRLKRKFFEKVQAAFREHESLDAPKILFPGEVMEFQRIRNETYLAYTAFCLIRDAYRKSITLPVLGSAAKFVRTRLLDRFFQ